MERRTPSPSSRGSSRIGRLSVLTHANDLGGRLWNPAIRWTTKHAVFVLLEDEEGGIGVGECWCFDRSPEPLVAYLREEVASHVLGQALDALDEISGRLRRRATLTARHGLLASAWSGVDIAAWDLRARRRGLPLHRVLDPSGDGTVPMYASGGLYGRGKGVDELVGEMRALADEGFDLLKMKVGGLPLAADLERVRAVLDALPPDVRLIVDGVYACTPDEALRLYESLPPERIEAFQSPIAADDIDAMARLVDAGVPVMGTEAEYRAELQRALVERGAVRFLQTAPIACGGITRLRALAGPLDGTPIRLSLEVSSTAVALMAACQFAAACGAVAHVEYHAVHRVFFERLALRRCPERVGHRVLPEEPGIGIAMPTDAATLAFETAI